MASKKRARPVREFQTVKRIDNSRLVRHVEPVKLRYYYRTLALGSVVAAFFMLYIYQHFRCIDLSFQLEEIKAQQAAAATGLTEPLPTQIREYDSPPGAQVAAVRLVRQNRSQ